MELPIALDSALKALLSCHSVSSWKIAAEGQNPTVIVRLRPVTQQSVCQRQSGEHADTVSFKRKTPCQINRDRRRAEQYRQRKDNAENMIVAESRTANQSEHTVEQELNTKTNEKVPSENQHTTDCASDTVELAARGEAESATRGGCVGDGSEMETDTKWLHSYWTRETARDSSSSEFALIAL